MNLDPTALADGHGDELDATEPRYGHGFEPAHREDDPAEEPALYELAEVRAFGQREPVALVETCHPKHRATGGPRP